MVSLEFRRIELIKVLLGGSIMRKLINTNHRKVCFIFCFIYVCFICSVPLDYKTGFGGSFGVQKDRVDKSAVGWEHHEKVDKHESQKG